VRASSSGDKKIGGDASLFGLGMEHLEETNTADVRHDGRIASGKQVILQAAY